MSLYEYIIETADYKKVEKLETLKNPNTFWDEVRKLTKNTKSCHALNRWQILAEAQFKIITE